ASLLPGWKDPYCKEARTDSRSLPASRCFRAGFRSKARDDAGQRGSCGRLSRGVRIGRLHGPGSAEPSRTTRRGGRAGGEGIQDPRSDADGQPGRVRRPPRVAAPDVPARRAGCRRRGGTRGAARL
ncbi:MAG: putative Glutathione-regulated potassium-efflux system protein KefB, partial [uncultured Sphingosinicella sp.]